MSQKRRRRRSRLPRQPVATTVEKLTPEGRGLAHVEGKPTFIDYALPGEEIQFEYTRTSSKYDEGKAVEVLKPSKDRIQPECSHFGVCGGCSLQHIAADIQIQFKQQALLDHLQHLGNIQPETVLKPLRGPTLAYRYKARLGVRYVEKKGKVLVGFREKANSFIADLSLCKVLHASVGERIEQLGQLIMGLEARKHIPQIEVAISDDVTALIFRHLEPLSDDDRQSLADFARAENIDILLQAGGPDTVEPLWPEQRQRLFYSLPQHDVRIEFQPTDFTQVNPVLNEKMINQALEFMDLGSSDRVLDLFCGLGNFTLPMARLSKHVTGVEGAEVMVVKARENAAANDIANVEFFAADLSTDITGQPWLQQSYDKILLDPPRSGAMEMLHHLGKLRAECIVYVSCNPVTLARDTNILVNQYGYKLKSAGVMDMFPHTAHVESMAVFELG
ncbi:MAG: 23S rRNA (uracil(1939)-C(5))-methyltransferase RlmD [Gammaproteobacteria bacterium]|nr:23S rRNA (uracil(1939)-C(5))-methyltransferase RlmD [Gammaproteobacteria bacterium]